MRSLGRADPRRTRLAPSVGAIGLVASLLVAACGPTAAPPRAAGESAAGTHGQASAAASADPGAAPAPASDAAAPSTPAPLALRIAYATPEASMTPLWFAQDHGYLREYGLDAELTFLSSGRTDQGVITGETPVGFGANVITSRLGGGDIVAIAGVVNRLPFTLFAQPGIGSVQDLRGKTILTSSPGAIGSWATLMALRHLGLDPQRDVSLQPTGGINEKMALMAQGLGDATIFSPPGDLKAAELGLVPLFDLATMGVPAQVTAIGTSQAYARDHAEELRRVLRAYVAAVAQIRRDPEAAKAIIAKYTQTDDPAIVDHSYDYYRDVWGRPDFRVPPEAVQSILDVLDVPGAATARPADFVDNHFVDELEQAGFMRQVGAD
ncbi:MAG TPA: ABC transporter substrate-binding protein [Chloroflexota bacterium]|nr:ABC transporter substrate-binding protein [Chloroflexota bacterium]